MPDLRAADGWSHRVDAPPPHDAAEKERNPNRRRSVRGG